MRFESGKRRLNRLPGPKASPHGWHALGLTIIGAVVVLLAAFTLVSASSAGASPGSAKGSGQNGTNAGQGTETQVVADTAVVQPTQVAGDWEAVTLSELADNLGWPTAVTQDGSGSLSVSLVLSSTDGASVSIRPFDFSAGAQAAFQAEQQDALVAGFNVSSGQFHTYPAYTASMTSNSVVTARRLHWVAQQWIMGVDISGTGDLMSSLDLTAVGEQLLGIAIEHGLTPPPDWSATAIPTQARPSTTPTAEECNAVFSDVTSDYWAYAYIRQLACSGIISGYADGTFKPQSSTTRAQLTKMIVLSEGWTLANPDSPSFADVDGSHIFYRYVETAFQHGVVHGYVGGYFRPDAYVTRAEVAKMLVLARNWDLTVQSPAALCDVPVDHWAWGYIQIAIQHGSFSGYANGCFLPDAFATRAQLAKVILQSHE